MPPTALYNVLEQGALIDGVRAEQALRPVRRPPASLVGSRIEYIGAASSFHEPGAHARSQTERDSLSQGNDVGRSILDFASKTRKKPARCTFTITVQQNPAARVHSTGAVDLEIIQDKKSTRPYSPISTHAENIINALNFARDLKYVLIVVRDAVTIKGGASAGASDKISTTSHLLKFGSESKAKRFLMWFSDEMLSLAVNKGKIDAIDTEDFVGLFDAKEVSKINKESAAAARRKSGSRLTTRSSLSELSNNSNSIATVPTAGDKNAVTKRRLRRRSSSVELLCNLIDNGDVDKINKNLRLLL